MSLFTIQNLSYLFGIISEFRLGAIFDDVVDAKIQLQLLKEKKRKGLNVPLLFFNDTSILFQLLHRSSSPFYQFEKHGSFINVL